MLTTHPAGACPPATPRLPAQPRSALGRPPAGGPGGPALPWPTTACAATSPADPAAWWPGAQAPAPHTPHAAPGVAWLHCSDGVAASLAVAPRAAAPVLAPAPSAASATDRAAPAPLDRRRLPSEALQQLFALAGQDGLALQLRLAGGPPGATPLWRGRVRPPRLVGTRQRLRAEGLRLDWCEQRLGPLWLQRSAGRQGLLHTLWLADGAGRPWLRLAADRPADRPEPCAWRRLMQALGASGAP